MTRMIRVILSRAAGVAKNRVAIRRLTALPRHAILRRLVAASG
jgi:hypothetical protein